MTKARYENRPNYECPHCHAGLQIQRIKRQPSAWEIATCPEPGCGQPLLPQHGGDLLVYRRIRNAGTVNLPCP
jgi:hypothetical protein